MSLFKRSDVRFGTTPVPDTPYQRAGQAWDERIGSARVQARNWRLMAFGGLLLSCGLAGGLVWQSARGTITPWVVQVDKLGQAQAVAPAIADYQPTDPQIAWHLAHFIGEVRSIPADPIVLRQNWLDAYNYVTDKGALALNDYARVNDPFSKIGKTQVSVEVASVIRASDTSFRVEWIERHYADNALAATERWSAILTIVLQTPSDVDRLKKNPLGVYVHALNWSKELG
jgi:type IV secretion system protein VirB5